MSQRKRVNADTLGVVGDSFNASTQFYGALIQIAHHGQQPTCDEPAFRILRFVKDKADMVKSQKQLQERLPGSGNILFHSRNTFTLICKDLQRQVDPDHVWPAATAIKQQYLDYVKFVDTDFSENRRARRAGQQEDAKARQDAFIDAYNQKGWVNHMRQTHNIGDDVKIVPGMHHEAEKQAAGASTDGEAGQTSSMVTEDEVPYPENARRRGQQFAAVSLVVSDGDDMETILFIHGFFATEAAAKEFVTSDLNTELYPLRVDVVCCYEWIHPVRMLWTDKASGRIDNLEETSSDKLLQNNQESRMSALEANRRIKQEAARKKEMDSEVEAQLCERLGVTVAELTQVINHPAQGTDAIIDVAKIEDEAERQQKMRALVAAPAQPGPNTES